MVEPGDKKPGGTIQGLVCPETHLPLEPAPAVQVAGLAELLGSGEVRGGAGGAGGGVPGGARVGVPRARQVLLASPVAPGVGATHEEATPRAPRGAH
ncbi:MAG: hypothetical protein VX254_07840 [Planctomycetota bacterium]|nr:hypothetical protein [Planctomycetota bacterium]